MNHPRCFRVSMLVVASLVAAGCRSSAGRVSALKEAERLRQSQQALEKKLAESGARVVQLEHQVRSLQMFGPDRPLAAFAPVKIELASFSGGADYDNQPGDDGINVYLRLRDADGDLIKAPGQIRVQLLDNSDLQSPKTIGVFSHSELADVRKLWNGKFGSYHYTIRCPFPAGVSLPESGRLTVTAEFADYLTGATLVTVQEVGFTRYPQ